MIRVLCFGGPLDGQQVDLSERQASIGHFSDAVPGPGMNFSEVHYKLHRGCNGRNRWYFAVESSMEPTDGMALESEQIYDWPPRHW